MRRTPLDDAAIAELLEHIDVRALGACPACLLNAAWTMRDGTPRQVAGAVTSAASWTYPEIEDALRTALRRLRMRGLDAAEDALVDLDVRRWRSRLVRRIVERLCAAMADEMAGEGPVRDEGVRRMSLVPDDP